MVAALSLILLGGTCLFYDFRGFAAYLNDESSGYIDAACYIIAELVQPLEVAVCFNFVCWFVIIFEGCLASDYKTGWKTFFGWRWYTLLSFG